MDGGGRNNNDHDPSRDFVRHWARAKKNYRLPGAKCEEEGKKD
jgi:hypothetical protein